MPGNHNKLKALKKRCLRKGIKTIAALAREIDCSRPAIYFSLENPRRYPRVHGKIMEVLK